MNTHQKHARKKKSFWLRLKKGPFFILLLFITGLCIFASQMLTPHLSSLFSQHTETHTTPSSIITPSANSTPAIKTPAPKPRFSHITANNAALRIPVLMYHDVQDIPKSTNNNVIPKALFEEQLKWLKDNNYTSITEQEFIDAYQGKISLPKNSVLITFDDGFKSIKTIVNPLLKQYDMHAISFIIGSYINRPEWHLTESEIQEIAQDQRVSFESHTYDLHRDGKQRGILNETSIDSIVEDNQKNERILHHKTNILCYPFGIFNDNAINGLKKANIPFAFAIKSGKATWVELNQTKTSPFGDVQNPLALPRVRIDGDISLDTFKVLVTDTIK